MRMTFGQFSFLPPLTDEQITKQIQYALDHGWPISIETTDDPHPRNSYWEMFGLPMFDIKDAVAILGEVTKARRALPNHYIKVTAYDASLGRQTTVMSFVVNEPENEPGFRLERTVGKDRQIAYRTHSYASDLPEGERYGKS